MPDEGGPRRLRGMAAAIGALHLLGWGTLIAVVMPQHLRVGTSAFGFGIGATAYFLGLRHAFDADHVAAIDNATRRLMSRGERVVSVGFWFSLGHSTVVFGLSLLIAFGARSLPQALLDGSSGIRSTLTLAGTAVSVCFLFAVALMNAGSWRRTFRARHGDGDRVQRGGQPLAGGLLNRIVERAGASIEEPWQMYLVGTLFGLGFDTATEIALLVAAGTGSASGLPWYAILCLPVLFAAGMSLMDTVDGTMMSRAYGWSMSDPARRVRYSLALTGLSIAVAVGIGAVELAGLLHERLHLGDGVWEHVSSVDLNTVGFAIAGLLAVTWGVSLLVCKIRPAASGSLR